MRPWPNNPRGRAAGMAEKAHLELALAKHAFRRAAQAVLENPQDPQARRALAEAMEEMRRQDVAAEDAQAILEAVRREA